MASRSADPKIWTCGSDIKCRRPLDASTRANEPLCWGLLGRYSLQIVANRESFGVLLVEIDSIKVRRPNNLDLLLIYKVLATIGYIQWNLKYKNITKIR